MHMNKTLLSVLIIFIMLMISLQAYSARFVEEEEVNGQEKAQEITDSNENNKAQTEIQPGSKPEVQPEVQPANTETTTNNNNINQQKDSKASEISEIYGVILIALLVGLIIGGVALRGYISETYNYNIFSAGILLMGCVAIIMSWSSNVAYEETKTMTSDVMILIGVAVFIYVLMFIINFKNSTFIMAILSLFYQILLSATIVFIIVIILLKLFKKMSDKKACLY